MKILFISLLLAFSLLALVLFLDFLMGTQLSKLLIRLKRPFEVSEPAEIAIFYLFSFSFVIKIVFNYIVNKKDKNRSSRKADSNGPANK